MKPFVRVVGASLLAGCVDKMPMVVEPPVAPPVDPQEDAPVLLHPTANPPRPTANPPAPPAILPSWESVASGHPVGATNPPYPVLIVTRDTGACYKGWFGGMMRPPARQRAAGGLVLETTPEVAERNATQVQCPPDQPKTLLESWDRTPEEPKP